MAADFIYSFVQNAYINKMAITSVKVEKDKENNLYRVQVNKMGEAFPITLSLFDNRGEAETYMHDVFGE